MEIAALLERVETIWDSIRAHIDAQHEVNRSNMEQELIAMKELVDEWRVEQDVERKARQEIAIEVNVLRFVMRAYEYHLTVRSEREFTEVERAIGKELLLLLGQGMSRVDTIVANGRETHSRPE